MDNQKTNKFWNFVPENLDTSEPAQLILYGDISSYSSWRDDVITPKQFSDDLDALGDVSEIVVRINSGGGDVFAATAIYTRLKSHKAKISVIIDGWAASAATLIAMSGDVIKIPAAGAFMIHDPTFSIWGRYGPDEFLKLAEELKVVKNSVINAYVLKTGKDKEEISKLMSAETWYTGEDAVNSGFCDEVLFSEVDAQVENTSKVIVNSVAFNMSQYSNFQSKNLIPDKNSNLSKNYRDISGFFNKTNGKETNNTMNNSTNNQDKTSEIKCAEDLRNTYPSLVEQIENSAAQNERNRIKGIEDMALVGFEDIVRNAKFDKPMNAADVAMQIVMAQKKQGQNYLNDREDDIKNSGVNNIKADVHEDSKDKTNPYDTAIDKVLPFKN